MDPALASKVLQLANSATFGLSQPVVDLEQGVRVLGSEMIRTIAVTQAIFSTAKETNVISLSELFDHCSLTSSIANDLCKSMGLPSLDKFVTISASLLHDVGKILLVNTFPTRYQNVTDRLGQNQPLWELELEEFGATHQGVGAYLLDPWGLPSQVVEAVASHHSHVLCASAPLTHTNRLCRQLAGTWSL